MDSVKFLIFADKTAAKDSIIHIQQEQIVSLGSVVSEYAKIDSLHVIQNKYLVEKVSRATAARNIYGLVALALIIGLLL